MTCTWKIWNASLLAMVALAGDVLGQTYPDRPIRMVVPFSPGGGTDVQARLIAEKLRESLKQAVVVDNRAGASGLIGGQAVAEAAPDGYTLLFSTATLAINTTLYGSRMKFSAVEDLEPIIWVSSSPLVLVVGSRMLAKSLADFVAQAKRQSGSLVAGVNALGSASHLAAEMLKQLGKIDFTIVPYKGGGAAALGAASGEVDFLFSAPPSVAPHVKSGRLTALAVTTPKKSSAFPELPTMSTMFPGFESDNWFAMFFPKGVSKDKVAKIHSEVAKALRDKNLSDFYAKEGLDPIAGSPEQLAALVKAEIAKYAELIKKGNVSLQ